MVIETFSRVFYPMSNVIWANTDVLAIVQPWFVVYIETLTTP